jgi:hypothetical protein
MRGTKKVVHADLIVEDFTMSQNLQTTTYFFTAKESENETNDPEKMAKAQRRGDIKHPQSC